MEKNEQTEKIKRLKVLDKFLLFFGTDKIGFKEPDEEKHYTLKFLEKGILDIHETIEGKGKKYTSLGKLELKRFAELIGETLMELLDNLKKIDINDPKYKNVEVYLMPKKQELQKVAEVRKKDIVLREDIMENIVSVPMKDLADYDFQVAIFSREDREYYCLFQKEGKYFLLKMDDIEKWMNSILEKLGFPKNS